MAACNSDCGFYTKEGAGSKNYWRSLNSIRTSDFLFISVRVNVFTRDQFPSQNIVDEYKAALAKCEIPDSSLNLQNQNNCSFWSSTE